MGAKNESGAMWKEAEAVVTPELAHDEQLLWSGAPRRGLWARPGIVVWALTGPLFFFFWFAGMRLSMPQAVSEPFLAVAAFCYLLYLTGIVYDVKRRDGAAFALTDRRAFSMYWLFGMRVESLPWELVDTVTAVKHPDGSGTITFGMPENTSRTIARPLADWPLTGPLVFDMIERVDEVTATIDAARVVRRETVWQALDEGLTPSFAQSGDVKIAYVQAGAGDPIIFLHGVGATKRCWALQLRGLARKFRCIALDYRGYGDSSVPPVETISREAYARDVAAVMDAAGVDKAVLCGNSLGGVVALEFYKRFSERVKSLILVDSFAYYPGGAESIPGRLKTLDDLGIEEFAATRSRALFAPDAPAALVERARADLASIPLDVYRASTAATWSGDYRALLPKIDVGVLVVWGELDTTIAPRALSEELIREIPASEDLAVVDNAGHIPQMEQPLAFNAIVADFLS